MSKTARTASYTPRSFGADDASKPRVVIVTKVENERAQIRDEPSSKLYVVPVRRLTFH